MIDKKKLERRFSRNAKTYDDYAVVQKQMSRKLISNIVVKNPKKILEIGCGTGFLTELIAKEYPDAQILALDLAPGMIDVARDRLSSINTNGRINFKCADAESAFPEDSYDLIISNATFQWFNHPDETTTLILNNLSENGQCLFSTFGERTFFELGEAFKMASSELNLEEDAQASQNFHKGDEWTSRLKQAKSQLQIEAAISVSDELLPEYFEDCMAFFQSVKKIGANNASASRSRTTPKFMQTVTEIYEREFRTDEGVCATYHALYLSLDKSGL